MVLRISNGCAMAFSTRAATSKSHRPQISQVSVLFLPFANFNCARRTLLTNWEYDNLLLTTSWPAWMRRHDPDTFTTTDDGRTNANYKLSNLLLLNSRLFFCSIADRNSLNDVYFKLKNMLGRTTNYYKIEAFISLIKFLICCFCAWMGG